MSASCRPLCLDLGHTTGWAFYDATGEIYGEVEMPRTSWPAKLDYFARWLTHAIDDRFRPTLIVCEEPSPMVGLPAVDRHLMHGQFAFAAVIAERRDVRFLGRATSSIKKHATGNGRATKQRMIAAVNGARPNREIGSDHVADAVALLDLVREEEGLGHDAFLLRAAV